MSLLVTYKPLNLITNQIIPKTKGESESTTLPCNWGQRGSKWRILDGERLPSDANVHL